MYDEDDFLMLSGLQHFAFCRRQWALIHIEQQWAENAHTVDGNIFHKKAHDAGKNEKRGDTIIMRGLRINSRELGISGICDVVEFHKAKEGIRLNQYDGRWIPYPVEYKKGKPKENPADELQLCAQAICLEEMLACKIDEGALFYGENRRRTKVEFTDTLRNTVGQAIKEMHELWNKGYTPRIKRKKACNGCSLKQICLPELEKTKTVKEYLAEQLEVES